MPRHRSGGKANAHSYPDDPDVNRRDVCPDSPVLVFGRETVAMADQVRSHGTGSYQVDAHDPVAGGRDSTGDRYSTAMAVITAVVMLTATRNTYLGAGHKARAGCP